MILKRNISTFAAVLGLMAIMLLSASPAQAFKTTNPDMAAAYDQCLTNKYQGKAKNVKKCFEDFRTTYAETCLVENQMIDHWSAQFDILVEQVLYAVSRVDPAKYQNNEYQSREGTSKSVVTYATQFKYETLGRIFSNQKYGFVCR